MAVPRKSLAGLLYTVTAMLCANYKIEVLNSLQSIPKHKSSYKRQLSEYSICLHLGCPHRTDAWFFSNKLSWTETSEGEVEMSRLYFVEWVNKASSLTFIYMIGFLLSVVRSAMTVIADLLLCICDIIASLHLVCS